MSKDDKIKLDAITVLYGKTTLSELLKAGYSVEREPWDWDYESESKSVMYSFFKGKKYIGQLVFFDAPDTHNSDDLISRPINLVLLEEPQETGLFGFFEKLGIKGRRSLILLGILYAVCWLIIIPCNVFGDGVVISRIPTPLIYVTAAFPFLFFALLLLTWGINSFFSLMFRKLSFPLFVLFCLALWLLWTYGNTLACLYLTSGLWNGWGRMIPITFMLITAGYAGYHVRIHYMFEKGMGFRYYLLHWSLFALSTGGFSLYRYYDYASLSETLFTPGSVAEVFFIFTLATFFIYSYLALVTTVGMNLEIEKFKHK